MPPGKHREMLREKYKTVNQFETAVEKHGSQQALAKHLGVNTTTLYEHKQWLKRGKKHICNKSSVCRFTDGELDERVQELFGSNKAEIKVYKLTDEYKPQQLGTEGLVEIGIGKKQTLGSCWARREKAAK